MKNAVQSRFIIKKVILNLIQDLQRILLTITSHPRKLLSGIPTLFTTQSGGDSRLQISGMTPLFSNCAFTLIELLVVVLIIGILAAVALPQYQKAVMKSRFATLKPIAKSIKDAQEIYFETYGHYAGTGELDDLDIDIPEGVDVELSATDGHDYVSLGHDKLNNRYTQYLAHSDNYAGNIYCEALSTDDQAKSLCVAEGAKEDPVGNDGYLLYLLSGNSTGGVGPSVESALVGTCDSMHLPLQYTTTCGTNTYSNGIKIEYYEGGMNSVNVIVTDNGQPVSFSYGSVGSGGSRSFSGAALEQFCQDYPYFSGISISC